VRQTASENVSELKVWKVAAVMVAYSHITASAQIDLSYSPGGAIVHACIFEPVRVCPSNYISIGSPLVTRLVHRCVQQTDRRTDIDHATSRRV